MPKCRVYGCEQNRVKGVVTHRFPYKTDLERAEKWLIACRIEFGNIKTYNFKDIIICGKHFAADAYEEDLQSKLLHEQNPDKYDGKPKKILKSNAMPTLYMPGSKPPQRHRPSTLKRQQREERKKFLAAIDGECSTNRRKTESAPEQSQKKRKADEEQPGSSKKRRRKAHVVMKRSSDEEQPGPSKKRRHKPHVKDPTTREDGKTIPEHHPSGEHSPIMSVPDESDFMLMLSAREDFEMKCKCACTVAERRLMTSQGTQTQSEDVQKPEPEKICQPQSEDDPKPEPVKTFGELRNVKLDHHYYIPTPKKVTMPERNICEQATQPTAVPQSTPPELPIPVAAMVTIEDLPNDNETDQESDQESSSSRSFQDHSSDPDYMNSSPSSSSGSTDEKTEATSKEDVACNYVGERKWLVFESQLHELLKKARCNYCGQVLLVDEWEDHESVKGSALTFKAQCLNGHDYSWCSQPLVGHGSASVPVGNLLIPAALLYSGCSYGKVSHFASLLNMGFMSRPTYNTHQRDYLFPVIHDTWADEQEDIWHDIRSKGAVDLAGDARCDSPGYSAKFGTYATMDINSMKIVDIETVQVTEVTSSNAMEKEGCRRILDRLEENMLIKIFCTDRHMGIQKMVREDYDFIIHQFDVWHFAKSVANKLIAKAKKKEAEELMAWVPAIKNHLWWSAASCEGDETDLLEKWQSVSYHVTNRHEWGHGQVFQKCAHDVLSDADSEEVKWLKPESPAHVALNQVLSDKRLLTDMKKLNHYCHTGNLENFNGFLTKYCPKRVSFSHEGMVARSRLAALDHNHNVGRQQAVVKQPTSKSAEKGAKRYSYVYTKQKRWTARPIFEEKDYSFIDDMMVDVLVRKMEGRKGTDKFKLPDLPENVAPASASKPSKEDAIAAQLSRFT